MTETIRRYQILLNDLNNLANTISKSINELENAIIYVKKSLNIGNTNYKERELTETLEELKIQYNNLVNVYIPEVRRKINELILEQKRIEEAKRKAAEEAAKKAEEAKKEKNND